MKRDRETTQAGSSVFIKWQIVLAVAIISVGFIEPVHSQTHQTALLLQQTPVNGGIVTPGIGVHNLQADTELTLYAVPKQGYQFVCWIGDVSNQAASRTVVYLDVPKIVIAVFERVEFEVPLLDFEEMSRSVSQSGVAPHATDYARGGINAVSGKRPHKFRWPDRPEEPDKPQDFPVPESSDYFPVPDEIPEPATIILLGAPSAFLLMRRRKLKSRCNQVE